MKKYLSILLVTLLAACHKSTAPASRTMPPYTTTGANVVACKENGEVWIAQGNSTFNFSATANGVYFTPMSDYLLISATNVAKKLVIQFDFKDTVGSYPLLTQRPLFGVTFYDGHKTYFTDSTHGGTINVLYYQGTIMSGTFSFDAVDSSGNVLHMTEGEFDING